MATPLTIRRTLNIELDDIPLLNSDFGRILLRHKFVIWGEDLETCKKEIEAIYIWVRDNVSNHYMVREPIMMGSSDLSYNHPFKFYVYFSDRDEAMQFKLSFPIYVDNDGTEGAF